MAWDKGFNFRATSGYVTDGANETYVLHTEAYPTTRNGVTFGWSGTYYLESRDRDSAIDPRLAGCNFDGTTVYEFRVDLPAPGQYSLRLALGQRSYGSSNYFQFKDDTSVLATISGSTAEDHFLDAFGTDFTYLTWPAGNQPQTFSFSSQVFKALIGNVNTSAVLAHIFIGQAVAGPVNLKTVDGLVKASCKTINGLVIASVKTVNDLA